MKMPRAIDVTGQRYGRLIALRPNGNKKFPSGQVRTMWSFRCDCGKEIDRTLFDVRRADTKSCGCARKGRAAHNRMEEGESSFNGLYTKYKRAAHSRNYEWNKEKKQ